MSLTEQQKADRVGYISSGTAALLMAGRWSEAYGIVTGATPRKDLSRVFPVQFGLFSEAFNRRWYTLMTGREVTDSDTWVQHPDYSFIGGHIDGRTKTSGLRAALFEAKQVGRTDEITLQRWLPQLHHYCEIDNVEHYVLGIIVGNSRWEMIEGEIDPLYANDLLARELEFWVYVERGEEPEDRDPATGGPMIRKPLRTVCLDDSTVGTWPNWAHQMIEEFGSWARTKDAATANAIARESIKELLPEDVGLVTRGRIRVSRNRAGAVTIKLED